MATDMFPKWLRGKVVLLCRGPDFPALINRAVEEQIVLEDVSEVDVHGVRLTVPLPDVLRFIRLARKAGYRVNISSGSGWPFFVRRIKRRKTFAFGFLLFLGLLVTLSSFVWNVRVEGTERIPAAQVKALLRQEGIFEGGWKVRMPDPEIVRHRLMMKLPQASWIGIRVEGTRVVVTVVEKKPVEPPQTEFEHKGPVHLVARKDALIRDMRVERGNPLVQVGDQVRKGQVIVSGIYGLPGQEGKIAGASGKVLGEVWYVSEVTAPLTRKRKVYTGNRHVREIPYLFGRAIRHPFVEPPPFSSHETVARVRRLKVAGLELPIGWVKEELLETEWTEETLSEQEAAGAGMAIARLELAEKLGADGRILGEKVLHRRVENGKVYLKVHFDAIENIAIPQPILQGE
ncbi:sporulation protein YqfD [Staphylospora marina]|uniref:sporulation protein YqfD n=1 Tax=Staphylospora marina TaxID=2490858 RepID=UPI0013DE5ACC|nr:sporulation protein YqfD [Staphylospora marina]